jgi:hypothetical protein
MCHKTACAGEYGRLCPAALPGAADVPKPQPWPSRCVSICRAIFLTVAEPHVVSRPLPWHEARCGPIVR